MLTLRLTLRLSSMTPRPGVSLPSLLNITSMRAGFSFALSAAPGSRGSGIRPSGCQNESPSTTLTRHNSPQTHLGRSRISQEFQGVDRLPDPAPCNHGSQLSCM